ncbi:MAG: endonuclease/exonuclease/phosphatase family protein [Phycisphaerae bacterium]
MRKSTLVELKLGLPIMPFIALLALSASCDNRPSQSQPAEKRPVSTKLSAATAPATAAADSGADWQHQPPAAETARPALSGSIAAAAPRAPTGTFIDRSAPGVLRVMTYNIMWNSIFPDVSEKGAARFARVLKAIDPDVLALQEIGTNPQDRDKPNARRRGADDVSELLARVATLPGGMKWHIFEGGSNVIASKYPLQLTRDATQPPAQRGLAMAYIELPRELYAGDLYLVNSHHKCCGGAENDGLRQQQSDGIVNWLRDARNPGGWIELPPRSAMIVLGDFNIVGGQRPLNTLITGDIGDEKRYGPDSPPDWDDTSLADAHPLHNVAGPDDWTWRDDRSEFKPGRLDYIIFSDSVLEIAKTFVLDTTLMSEADLKAAGLEKFDIAKDDVGRDFDHLPLIADITFRMP